MNNGRDPTRNGEAGDPTVVACVVFQTQDPERLVEVLRQALAGIPEQVRPEPPRTADLCLERPPEDFWLKHAEAAEYLEISQSTLYRYAEQGRIQSCKLANRLKYRRSALDNFKDQNIRPARRSIDMQCIIPSAPVSGK
jgi:excisionase family DNA binding protein